MAEIFINMVNVATSASCSCLMIFSEDPPEKKKQKNLMANNLQTRNNELWSMLLVAYILDLFNICKS
jgi:hypothetical protein